MKKVKKFGAGDLVTGIGAVLLGKALYDKYKGKDDDEKEPEAVGGASRRPKTIEEQIGRKAEPKDEKRREISDYMTNKPKKTEGGETRSGSDTTEPDLDYKDKTPKPVVKKAPPAAQPKKVESKRGLMDEPPAKLGSQGSFKFDSKAAEDVKSTPKPADDASKKTNKYGIGPYGAFGSIHKAMSEYKTPAEARSEERRKREQKELAGMKKGGMVKSSASKRADGIAQRGKTRGRIC